MIHVLRYLTLVVPDQDQALAFYTGAMGFELRQDSRQGGERRLSIGIPGQDWPQIALQATSVARYGEATHQRKLAQIGNNPTWVLAVDDCRQLAERMRRHGGRVLVEAAVGPDGQAALVADCYGNSWYLVDERQDLGA
ncbi:VOC family protein [Chitinimonas sp.]|uniref:VOC family protein n=1 Tax=Chitinimonas sp. TaxID=1934313 RepID=UPI002F91C24C